MSNLIRQYITTSVRFYIILLNICVDFCPLFSPKITVVQLHWTYDDEMKLFDLSRICLMFLCSKHLYTNTLTVNSVAVEKG